MALVTSTTLVSGADASASFVTAIAVQNYSLGAIQVVWSGIDDVDGYVAVQGSQDGTNYDDVTCENVTMVATASNQLFNITDMGYNYLQLEYDAGSVTTGTVSVIYTLKPR